MIRSAAILVILASVAAASVADGYATPTIAVPRLAAPPTIDGAIGDDEWRDAISVTALQTTERRVSQRQATFLLGWDPDHLWLAMRSPLRPGERPIQAHRSRERDIQDVVFDDSWEFWIDVGSTTPDGQPTFFQYLSNLAGARFDVLHEPAVGNMRFGWTAGWTVANRVTPDGQAWEMEAAIPRTSLYLRQPLADGFALRTLLARNFKRPWSQATIEGSGSFSQRDTFSRLVLRDAAPALAVAVTDGADGGFGLALTARSRAAQRVRWRFASDGGARDEGTLAVPAGGAASLRPEVARDGEGDGRFRLTIASEDGAETWFDWCAERRLGDLDSAREAIADRDDAVGLTLAFNPVADYLRVSGDFIGFAARDRIAAYRIEVRDAAGGTIAGQDLALDDLAYVAGVVPLPGLPAGEFQAVLTCRDAAGAVVVERAQPFAKKDPAGFPWWKTTLGDCDRVLAPWTPMTLRDATIGAWGREMTVGAAGLPARISSQGRELLAGPARLVATDAAGATLVAAPAPIEIAERADHRVVARTASALGDVRVEATVTAEYDGMYRVDLTLTPARTTTVRALRVEVPLAADVVEQLHATGEGIRSGFDYRFLPKDRRGTIWDSRIVDSQPMLAGSFIPYLWVGDSDGGLCWFADSDQGWEPSDSTPAIAIERGDDDVARLVLNLISAPTTLAAPRAIAFAFQATPVKPIRAGWRMDSWWTGDTFKDWAGVEQHGGHLIFTSLPFPLDPAASKAMVDARHAETNAGTFGFAKYRANAVPYFEHIALGERFVPEADYFREEWRTTVSRGFDYGGPFADFMVDHVGKWARDCGIDGFYLDNVHPLADDNLAAGRGYRLPDGRIQPTYRLFATRRYLLRLRAALAEQGKSGALVVHMTNNMIIPWVGAADIALDGEMNVIYPEMGRDFIDCWSRERIRACVPSQWGVAVTFLQEHQGDWKPEALKTAMRAYTGLVLAHDVLASANPNGLNQEAWRAREAFGVAAEDVRFVGYWRPRAATAAPAAVLASAWVRPGTALVVAVDTGEAADAAIDCAGLGLGPLASARDAETGEALAVDGTVVRAAIARHDYRHIVVIAREPGP